MSGRTGGFKYDAHDSLTSNVDASTVVNEGANILKNGGLASPVPQSSLGVSEV